MSKVCLFDLPLVFITEPSLMMQMNKLVDESNHNLTNSLLKGCSDDSIEKFLREQQEIYYTAGTTLFKEGEQADYVYCVLEGAVKMIKEGADRQNYTLKVAGQGDLLGVPAIMDESHQYHGSCRAITSLLVARFPALSFIELMRANPTLALTMMRDINKEIHQMEEKMGAAITKRESKKRLVHTLLTLHDKLGSQEKKQTTIDLPQSDIADLAGISLHRLRKFLGEMEEDGWLYYKGTTIQLMAIENMKKLVANTL